MAELSGGKLRNLTRLADEKGRFKMMAIDQRTSMLRALAQALRKDEKDVTYDEVALTKRTITCVLAPHATAVLTDPKYGYPYSLTDLPGNVSLLLCYEETREGKVEHNGIVERKAQEIGGWSIAKAARAGANAVKLLIRYNPHCSKETVRHQQRFVEKVGKECERYDLPFLLEITSYGLEEQKTNPSKPEDTPTFAEQKPALTVAATQEFSDPKYKVDILKLEFPADLKYTEEYGNAVFDGKKREAVYSLKDVREACRKLDQAAGVPWVILSAGVDIAEFIVNVELACEAGASGFLCGRAIWKGAVSEETLKGRFNLKAMERWLEGEGVYNFVRANAAAETAQPWFNRPPFNGEVTLSGQGEGWLSAYHA